MQLVRNNSRWSVKNHEGKGLYIKEEYGELTFYTEQEVLNFFNKVDLLKQPERPSINHRMLFITDEGLVDSEGNRINTGRSISPIEPTIDHEAKWNKMEDDLIAKGLHQKEGEDIITNMYKPTDYDIEEKND